MAIKAENSGIIPEFSICILRKFVFFECMFKHQLKVTGTIIRSVAVSVAGRSLVGILCGKGKLVFLVIFFICRFYIIFMLQYDIPAAVVCCFPDFESALSINDFYTVGIENHIFH